MRNKFNNDEQYSFYEDTHDQNGKFLGKPAGYVNQQINNSNFAPGMNSPQQTFAQPVQPALAPQVPQQKKSSLSGVLGYNNVVVYEPKTTADVQDLIDYLKRKEPAIVDLDGVEPADSQRMLDFFSGAVYALSGNIHRIKGNIFLLTPEGVAITAPL